jgi:hypothetical protein
MTNPRTLWRLVIWRSTYGVHQTEEVRYIETATLEEAVESAKRLAGKDGYSLTEYCQVERSA